MNPLLAAERRFAALYDVDARGRTLRIANLGSEEPDSPPRFHLVRTHSGNVWRIRAGLPSDLVRRLAMLAGKEAAFPRVYKTRGVKHANHPDEPVPPEREEFMRRALEEDAAIEAQWAGPVFAFPQGFAARDDLRGARDLRLLGEADRDALHPEISDAVLGEANAAVGAWIDGEIVSLCSCVRGRLDGPTEAGVRTAIPFQQQGHGAAVVASWAAAVLERGGEPFYSTAWKNAASRALARRLGLLFIGEERHWR